MYYLQHYKIDFQKVKTTEDIIRILKVLDISFDPNTKNIASIKDLTIIEEKNKIK